MHERPAIALEPLHDGSFAAEQPDSEPSLERDADAYALGGREERVCPRDELVADLGKMNRDDLARIGRAECDLPFLAASVEEHGHEERFACQQTLSSAHEGAHEAGLLLRSISEHR